MFLNIIDEKENKIYAIFDLRNALRSLKRMHIYYAKILTIAENNLAIMNNATIVFNVLMDIFRYVKEEAVRLGAVKIYAKDEMSFLVFSLMAKKLQKKDEYDVLLYSKWIEIAHNDLGQEDKNESYKRKRTY
jgi:hypothetical protein